MKIAIVGCFPPSKQGLNEYNCHLSRAIGELGHKCIAISNMLTDIEKKNLKKVKCTKVMIRRIWKFDSYFSWYNIVKLIRKEKPDVVIFSLIFSSFSFRGYRSFVNLLTPALVKFTGFKTAIILHHLYENIDMGTYGKTRIAIFKIGCNLITRSFKLVDKVFVLVERYREFLESRYRAKNVRYVSHGCFLKLEEPLPYKKSKNVLVMGKFGAYKKLDRIIEMVKELSDEDSDIKLIIAGRSHPYFKGHVEEVLEHALHNFIDFRGYVLEEHLPALFSDINVVVIPYDFYTGTSGIAHLAVNYGRPIVAYDSLEIEDLIENIGVRIARVPIGDETAFKARIKDYLNDFEKQKTDGVHNFRVGQKIYLSNIAKEIIDKTLSRENEK
ncbi:MAG: glycosyltransferase [Candidatus Aureabacteria bacterium]|nr:glycosyltransferase [Candidatus Auribacterota bacterium]